MASKTYRVEMWIDEYNTEWKRVEQCENKLAVYCEGFCAGYQITHPYTALRIIGKEGKLNRECVCRVYHAI